VKILVTAASKHGSTDEVARTIADVLTEAGHATVVAAPETISSVDGYDAIVVGSAVYYGRWLEPAVTFVNRLAPSLRARRVWLFSVGPLGDPPKPAGEPVEIASLVETCHAREHRTFPGRLDRRGLGLGEKLVVAGVRAAEGDFRPWPSIRGWARDIDRALNPVIVGR
jgi:menaquinone-dependent protoporphyrinogen oxidase